jgi:hypothetical protein
MGGAGMLVPPTGFAPPAGGGAAPAPVPARIWRLTRTQYNNTVADLLGDTTKPGSMFEPESPHTGFTNDESALGITKQFMSQANAAAQKLAAESMAQRLTTVFPDGDAKLGDVAAVKVWIARFGRRAFRRPLGAAEVDAYNKLYVDGKASIDAKTGVQLVVEAMLQSSHFLFRSELGDGKADARGRVTLTPHEVASALSYYLTNSMPDAMLDAAADSGAIMNRVELDKHARRLVGTDRAQAVVWDFFGQMLDAEALASLEAKTGPAAADFAKAKPNLEKETETFIADLFKTDGTWKTLVSANHTFVDSTLAKLYGVPDPGAGKWGKVMLDAKDRAGVLTQPALMALLAHPDQSSPVLRGKFVLERLLCAVLPEPPDNANVLPPKAEPAKTTRQRYMAQTETPGTVCAGCHQFVNPPGYLFEHIDWTGKVRRDEGGVPVDTIVTLTGRGDLDGRYANAGEFAAKLGDSKAGRECMAKQVFRYAAGANETAGDAGAIAEMMTAFEKAAFSIKELVLSHVLTERFVTRRAN